MNVLLKQIGVLVALSIVVRGDGRSKRVRRIVGGQPANMPPYDDPSVYVRFAGRTAKIRGVRDFPHFVFRGIPYAHPPVKSDRFLRPKQLFLNGTVDATRFPPPCMQPNEQGKIIGSEDCLFLNVFTPDLPYGTEGLPVIVWIHGGGFRYGSASQYGVRDLVGKRIVVVTIQYRLGSLGFLGTGTQELPGNSALWDMVLAVQWVRNYVGFFGGNPHQITVMGHGTGASSALLLALNDVGKGQSKGVVALSGTAVSHWAVDNEPINTAKELAMAQGCTTASVKTILKCLQVTQAELIIKADSEIQRKRLQDRGFVSGIQGRVGPMPVTETKYDGRSLPPMVDKEPLDEMSNKETPKIPLLTGITKDETKRAIHSQYEQEIVTKLTSVPHFLDNVLLRDLQSFTSLNSKSNNTNMPWTSLDPFKFRNYISVTKNNIVEGLGKIAEITADALFNLPAFLTADLWSKNGAPAFLYSFEHKGKSRAHYFLQGLPFIGNATYSNLTDAVSHGDELIYLFEARSLNGTPIAEADADFTEDDHKMRSLFTSIIAAFARHGKVSVDNQEAPPFSEENNNYLQITTKPRLLKNFRFCEMALWAGLTQRLQMATCSLYNVLQNIEVTLFDTVSQVAKPIEVSPPLQNITSQLQGAKNQFVNVLGLGNAQSNNNKPANPNPFNFGVFRP